MHQDHVPSLPAGFESLGSTDICPVHGMVRYAPRQDNDASSTKTLQDVQVITLQGESLAADGDDDGRRAFRAAPNLSLPGRFVRWTGAEPTGIRFGPRTDCRAQIPYQVTLNLHPTLCRK